MFEKLKRGFRKTYAFCMRKNNRVVTLFMLLGACIFVLTPAINPFIQLGEQWYLNRAASHIGQDLETEQGFIDRNLTLLASSQELRQLIATKDLDGLNAFFQNERTTQGFDLMLATDEHGVALMRSSLSSNRGDYIFNVTAWGQAASQNGRVVAIERGVTYPLIMIGGQMLKNQDGSTIGAIFIGHQLNSAYLDTFRNKYLPHFMNAVLYTKQDGAVANTFVNPALDTLAPYYFTPTSRWAQETIGIANPELIAMNGKYFFARNITFSGLQTSPGGIILLFPYSPLINIVIFVLIFTGIFCLIAHAYSVKTKQEKLLHPNVRKHAKAIVGFSIFTVFLAFFANMYYGIENTGFLPRLTPTLYNSTLSLQPGADIFTDSMPHTITVDVSSGGELINAIQTNLTYDPSIVAVQRVNLDGSVCASNLFSQTTIDQAKGIVTIECVTSPNGFQGQNGIVAQLSVMPKHTGLYTMHFDMAHTHVFASDGLGTDVLRAATGGSYQIKKSSDSPTMPSVSIFSLTHPNGERWYSTRNISLSWDPNREYSSYVYAFDATATTEPSLPVQSNSISLLALQDGIQYFHVAGVRGGVRGPISHFKIMIDATPPDKPVIQTSADTVAQNETVRINVSSRDAASGLQRFMYARVNNSMFLPFSPPTSYSFPKAGTYTLVIRIFDNAGNWSEATRVIRVASPSVFQSLSNLLPTVLGAFVQSLNR